MPRPPQVNPQTSPQTSPQVPMDVQAAPASADPFVAFLSTPRRDVAPDLTTIPEFVASYFSARGYHCTLGSANQTTVMAHSTFDRFALVLEDVADESERDQLKRALLRHGFQIRGGYPMRGDCYIYIQPHEARDRQINQGRARFLAQDDPRSADPTLTEINQLFKGAQLPLSHARADDVGRLSDHAVGVDAWEE